MAREVKVLVIAVLLSTVFSMIAAAESTIVFWHWNREDRQAALDPLIRQFEDETGIKVESQMVAWEELPEKLILATAGGVAPDVTAISSDRGVALLLQGLYADLGPFIAAETEYDFDDLLPNALELWQSNDGKQLAFPFDLDISGLFYNPNLFDAMGLPYPDASSTWEDTLDAAKRLTVDTDGDGRFDQHGFINGFISPDTFIWAYGGELLTPDGTNHALGSAEARAGIEMWREFAQPEVNLDWGDAAGFGFSDPTAAFAAGRAAMIPIGAWGPSAFWQDPATKRFLVDFDVTYMPKAPYMERAIPMAGQGVGIVNASTNKEAAWEFVKFLASADVQEISARDLGQFPVLRSVALSDAFIVPGQPPANMPVVVESTLYARFHPKVSNWPEVWTVIRSQISQFVVGAQPLSSIIQTLDEVVPGVLSR